jgi:hypothetical protein
MPCQARRHPCTASRRCRTHAPSKPPRREQRNQSHAISRIPAHSDHQGIRIVVLALPRRRSHRSSESAMMDLSIKEKEKTLRLLRQPTRRERVRVGVQKQHPVAVLIVVRRAGGKP